MTAKRPPVPFWLIGLSACCAVVVGAGFAVGLMRQQDPDPWAIAGLAVDIAALGYLLHQDADR